ncbi:enoyl-CoA hydratase/isomerase family protein [Gottfriedia luciferensis]|uniref:enoyl-CoA hydratase/isomerase family protein n=1 Tax=Gottfriedia luciferensis TaxID=178774 RepID=UPI0013029880|nr:enoyl-CoA hydratase/isomerase family protein [Gottfriedia luciferensis]
MAEVINYQRDEIEYIFLNRPNYGNCIDENTADRLLEVIQEIRLKSQSKLVILTGEGLKYFCTGGDLNTILNFKNDLQALESFSLKMCEIIYQIAMLPQITICFINGYSLGGGCELASACDFRYANHNAKIGFIQGRLGIPTSWGGGTILLEKMNHQEWITLLSSSNIYTAFQAKKLGFIHELSKDLISLHNESFINLSRGIPAQIHHENKKILIRKWNEQNLKKRMQEEVFSAMPLWFSDEHIKNIEQFTKKLEK